jgi:thiol-disulfide isomerase/thioredoxin
VGARILIAALALLAAAPAGAAGPTLDDPLGGQHSVALEPGAPVLHLVFFATWCPACVEELESLSELRARWEPRGYKQVIVAVQARHSAERLAEFFAARPAAGRVLFDARGEAERQWGARSVPTHVLLDAAGKELARSGSLDASIESAIEQALAARRGR